MEQEVLKRIMEEIKEAVEWSKNHRGLTLQELEERVQKAVEEIRVQLMEEVVTQQGTGEAPEQCTCGGRWVFKGYKEREVMTKHGPISVRRAYYVCNRCGAGLFPPGRTIGELGGVE